MNILVPVQLILPRLKVNIKFDVFIKPKCCIIPLELILPVL